MFLTFRRQKSDGEGSLDLQMGDLPSWLALTSSKDTCEITLYVQPGAKMCGIAGEFNRALKIKISARPVDGAANDAVRRWIAEKLRTPLRDVRLLRGQTSRRKVLEISGLEAAEIVYKLLV
jgi:uncharacterized protein (TIGR00251 family)